MIALVGELCAAVACLGCLYLVAAMAAVSFRPRGKAALAAPEPVSILKPLHGREPRLDDCLASFCAQDYEAPAQIVFGLHDGADPARAPAKAIEERFPEREIAIVIDGASHGTNAKISNLINMAPAAKYDILIVADSDILAPSDYLTDVVALLQKPGAGAVTVLYTGEAAGPVWSKFAALGINTHFLPNVLMGLALGLAKPCFGSTIALRRETLEAIGGFPAFANQLADDYAIGAAVRKLVQPAGSSHTDGGALPSELPTVSCTRANKLLVRPAGSPARLADSADGTSRGEGVLGLSVEIGPSSVSHVCHEESFLAYLRHQLRWARTVRSIDMPGYLGSFISHPFAIALLGIAAGNGACLALAALALALRVALCKAVERSFKLPRQDYWLLPFNDCAAFGVFVWSFFGTSIAWKRATYTVLPDGTLINPR